MAKATVQSLTEKERMLIAETQPPRLRQLDEDELVELHTRVRRARNKFVKLHRRQTSERVVDAGGRGTANAGPRRSASKAEIFEDALARVSASLAKAARQSAAELRAERLAMARGNPAGAPVDRPPTRDDSPAASTPRGRERQPIERKVASSSRSTGARRQAKRDAR